MDGSYAEGWYEHPNHGLIKVFRRGADWVYQCYNQSGDRALSKPRDLDSWTWALSEPTEQRF